MKNDRLILSLVKAGRLTADLESGQVYLEGKPVGSQNKYGYVCFRHRVKGVQRILACQRVVWICDEQKLPPYGWICDHDDCNKANNARYNLEMVTQAVNCKRAHKNGCCDNIKRHNKRVNGKFVSN